MKNAADLEHKVARRVAVVDIRVDVARIERPNVDVADGTTRQRASIERAEIPRQYDVFVQEKKTVANNGDVFGDADGAFVVLSQRRKYVR